MVQIPLNSFWAGWRKRMEALANLPPVLKMLWDAGPHIVAGSMALRLVAALIPLGVLTVSRLIIDDVSAVTAHHQILPHYFWLLVAAEFALAAMASVAARSITFLDVLLGDRFTRHASIRIMDWSSKLDLASFENPDFYDRLERARVQATDRVAMIRDLGVLIQQSVTTMTLAASIAAFSPMLLVVLIGCLVPSFLGESHFAFLGYTLNMHQTPTKRLMDYFRTLGASKESAKELKLFGLGSFFTGRYTELSNEVYDQNRELHGRRLWMGVILSLLTTGGYYAAYAWVIYMTVQGTQSIGTMVFLTGAIAGTSLNAQTLFNSFSSIADQSLFLTDLTQFFAEKPAIISKPHALPFPRSIKHGIEFQKVSFTYPGRSNRVLSGLSFRWEPGERIALIGENGEGKTTIVKLLARLYDPTEGRILLDGVDLREYNLDDLWRHLGVVCQDFMKYEMPVTENIGMGRIDDRHNFAKLRDAARKSLADKVVDRLPHRYDQLLGRRFEGGVDLSGGEWQRIAIARAYMRDAKILVLDEPTASLDARAEHEVFQRFTDLTEGKMALFISHRFSTVRMADRILVLEDGRVAEEGTHDLLMDLKCRYFQMFELQAASYR